MGNHCRQMLSQFFRLLTCSDSGAETKPPVSLHRIGEKEDKIPKFCSTVTCDMDRISGLSDDLLIKILSFLPTEDAVSTSILSKRWECLWRWLPKLDFDNISGSKRFGSFLNRNLPLHRAPVIESFCLKLYSSYFKPEDVKLWVVIAVSRYLRQLEISSWSYQRQSNILPSSLYICKSLVILKLDSEILLDVPRMAWLPSLKTLQLGGNKYLDGESLGRLLSICPLLEDLSVCCVSDSDMGMITVVVPYLQRLSLYICYDCSIDGLVIDTPSLKYMELEDNSDEAYVVVMDMPKLEEAYVVVMDRFPDLNSLIGSITFVKRLTIYSEVVYGDGFVFNQLEHLKLCVCSESQLNLLVRLLQDSPNLQVLDMFDMDHYDSIFFGVRDGIDESLISSFKIFNWSTYLGQKKDLEVYFLEERLSLDDHYRDHASHIIRELSILLEE